MMGIAIYIALPKGMPAPCLYGRSERDGHFLPKQEALCFSLVHLPGNFLPLLKALGSIQLQPPPSSQPEATASDLHAQPSQD